jgi:hypothetical protein
MNTTNVVTPTSTIGLSSPLSWRAVFAGCFAGLSIHVLLTMLGVGLGFRAINPANNDNPVADFTVATGIVWTVSALISLYAAGWVAGRSIDQGDRRTGVIHGFIVWSVATVMMVTVLGAALGSVATGAAQLVGKGVSATAKATGSAASGAANTAANMSQDDNSLIAPYLDELNAAGRNIPATAKREIGFSILRFIQNPNDQTRGALITTLSDQGGIARPDAERMVGKWEDSYRRVQTNINQMKADAEQKAREAADKAASAAAKVSLWTFVAYLVGAFAASLGGGAGAKSAIERAARSDAAVTR